MQTGEIFVLGITHRTAPLGVRERLAFTPAAEAAFADDLRAIPGLAEFVILNTCNRLEIYGVALHPSVVGRVTRAFCQRQNLDAGEFAPLRLAHHDHAALWHLFTVAAGLDSQMLGETEVFGQVKKAYATAQARGTAGAVLNRIFQKAFQAVKQARSQTGITEGLVSVANVAVDLALKIFGPRLDAKILLLGAGDIGRKCGRAFLSRGATSLTIANRNVDKAAEIAGELGADALSLEAGMQRLAEFDVVLGATSAPRTVISANLAAAAMRQRQGRPLFFIDTALPRDIDAAVAKIEGVFLYDLDDLARIAAENRTARETEIARCESLLAERARLLWSQVERLLQPQSEPGATDAAIFPATVSS